MKNLSTLAGFLSCIFLLSCADEDSLLWYVPKKPPLAKCGIKSINEVVYVPGTVVKPLDDVMLTAEGSMAQMPGAKIVSYRWEKVRQPLGSMAALSDPAGRETRFIFAENIHGVDLAGNYRFKLIVTDSLGSKNTDECLVRWSAVPSGTLHIQLVWDTNYGDMDLHLAKIDSQKRYCVSALSEEAKPGPLATICSAPDFFECNYMGCRSFSEKERPDWDSDGSLKSDGDPSLDIDDLGGYGPENINIEHALGGSFLVSAHHFAGGRPSGNTVRLYLYGHLYAEFYRILKPNEWWEVALIHWPENMSAYPCIEDLATQQMECPRSDGLSYRTSSMGSSFTECSSQADCGPGTTCDMEMRDCVSLLNICSSDANCPIEKLCAQHTKTCVIPDCENDRHCQAMHDPKQQVCDLKTYTCIART